jgi:hypothetical protein
MKRASPYWKASPESARIEGHFPDPSDADKEADVEARLAQGYEELVNQLLYRLDDTSFLPSDLNRRHIVSLKQTVRCSFGCKATNG